MNEFQEAANISTCDYMVNNNFEAVSPCLVCGEGVTINNFKSHAVICEKCKEAILYMRNQLENIKWN